MTAPTITSLRGVNPYDPSTDFLVNFNGKRVYASTEDYWLVVLGTDLDTVTTIAFTKDSEADRPVVHSNIISSTRLEVMIPMTVLGNSYVTVTNPDGTATSARNVTPVYAGDWLEHAGTVNFDSDDFDIYGVSGPLRHPAVTAHTYGTSGSLEIGPNTDGDAPPLSSYADVVDAPVDAGPGLFVTNTISNGLRDPSAPGPSHDAITVTVNQSIAHVGLSDLFYQVLADLGVPGYTNTALLPAGAVEAIPDGTDLNGPFFDDRLSTLDFTIVALNQLPDFWEVLQSHVPGSGPPGDDYFDLSALAFASREDTVEIRAMNPASALSAHSMSALTATPLLGSITVPPTPPLRTPDQFETSPSAPVIDDTLYHVSGTFSVLGTLANSTVAYALVLTSARTYDQPTDPGEAPLLTWTWPSDGTNASAQGVYRTRGADIDMRGLVVGVGEVRRHVTRLTATWDPPRYRYWYTTPAPFTPPTTARTLRRRQQAAPVGSAPRRRQIANRAGSLRRGPGAAP